MATGTRKTESISKWKGEEELCPQNPRRWGNEQISEETNLSKNANCKVENGVILLRKKKNMREFRDQMVV